MDETRLQMTTLGHLNNGELFELVLSITQGAEPFISDAPRLQIRFNTLKDVFVIFDNGFKRPLSAPETEEIRTFDMQRRGVFTLLDDSVKKNARYSVIPEVKAAAAGLLPVFDNYAGAPDAEYEAETAFYVNLLQELRKPENAARIQRLGQTENVTALEQINVEFQTFYQTRLKNRYDFKQEGTTRQRGKNLIDELVKFTRAVDGLLLSASAPDEIAALNGIIANINALMEQYTIIVHRRIGVKSKKKTDDKKDEETQAPDTPTETPDTTNPEDTNNTPPTQNPSDEPHHLDPGEHPAAGE
ncbi:MAG: DUF6261 family protein [Tannerellaceae bacterium]|jgi:hypothetical protein|nr:DUF6261 family protein [Tannerellaceae bacterium]